MSMGRALFENLIISDSDIDWVEGILGPDITFDYERRTVIKNLENRDVQAFPGSGKTTALIAKLAILAKKWPSINSGICVFSHTNVAREEIERRLGKTDIGGRLLSYPHFIGTIHNFFNTYVALPWLRSQEIEIHIIDTEIATNYRWKKLPYGTKKYLEMNHQDESICSFKKSLGDIDWKKSEGTKDEIVSGIFQSHKDGIFTYEEMLLYAQQALLSCESIKSGLQNRFPLVFMDEAQDTNSLQWDLILSAFSENCTIRQSFGDSNQAIYSFIDEESDYEKFPRGEPLLLSKSRRFDDRIAAIANTVAVSGDQMQGIENDFSRPRKEVDHTIFLFQCNKNSCERVLTAYGQLLLRTFTDEEIHKNQEKGCHVIGFVHIKKDETSESQFPKGVFDYWPAYDAGKEIQSFKPNSMIDYYRQGLTYFKKDKEYDAFVNILLQGLRHLVNISKIEKRIPATGYLLASMSNRLSDKEKLVFRKKLYDIINKEVQSKFDWELVCQYLLDILVLFKCSSNQKALDFLRWGEEPSIGNVKDLGESNFDENSYLFLDDASERTVIMQLGSIHSEKGRTHLSTLVLETFYRTHNFKSILPYLCGQRPKKLTPAVGRKLRVHYVAMTRAKGLLCLAIPQKYVSDEAIKKLEASGWKICIIS